MLSQILSITYSKPSQGFLSHFEWDPIITLAKTPSESGPTSPLPAGALPILPTRLLFSLPGRVSGKLRVHSLTSFKTYLDIIPLGGCPHHPSPSWRSSPDSFSMPCSPHSVEVIIRGHVVLIVTGKAQFIPVALVNEVPELLGTQGLQWTTE